MLNQNIFDTLKSEYPEYSDKFYYLPRPKFYGNYIISMSLEEDLSNWHMYYDNKNIINNMIMINGFISGSKHLLTYYCFINSIDITRKIIEFSIENSVHIRSVKISSDLFSNIKLKRKVSQNTDKWYGIYPYRIRLNINYNLLEDFDFFKNKMNGDFTISNNNPALIYLDNPSDALLFKMIYTNNVIEVDEHTQSRP